MQRYTAASLITALALAGCTRQNPEFQQPAATADGGVELLGADQFAMPASADQCPQQGATRCQSAASIERCVGGAWQHSTCDAVCKADGYHYSVGCKPSATSGKQLCHCGRHASFGQRCDDMTVRCAPGLFCGTFAGAAVGFCTRYCATLGATCAGAPPGIVATCTLQSGGKNACGFVCPNLICPAGLACDWLSGLCKP